MYMYCQIYLNVKNRCKIEYLNITSGWMRVCHVKVLHIKDKYWNEQWWVVLSVMCETARLQVLLVLLCNKWWTLWILFIIVTFIYYLQQATVILTEVVCCKSKAVMSRAGWDMLVSRDHLWAVLLMCLSWAGICNWWAGTASLGYLYLIILRGPYNTLPLSGAIILLIG